MKVGMVGLATLYWPMAIGNGLQGCEEVEFLGAATLDASDTTIQGALGVSSEEYAKRYNVKLYNNPEDMVTKEHLDTVVLTTKHTEHAIWVERMAKLGVNVYIPKTFTTTLSDAERIVQAQKRYGIKIAVGPSARYLPAFTAAKNAVDKGLIGQPFSIRICHHHGTIDVFKKNDWYRNPEEGGPELSLGWYGIDLILHFMGEKVKTVSADYGNFTSPDSPFMDCGRLTMRMDNDSIASFDMYFCNRVPYPSWQMEILGPKGVISIHRTEGDSTRTVVSLDSANGYELLPIPSQTPNWEMFWVEDFKSGRQPAISAEEAKLITQISLTARESASKGCPIKFWDLIQL
jgi:predicted dehydrogenase